MAKRTWTKIIFFSLVGLFLVAAPAAVLYSSGFRLDWKNRAITKTGGLYLKVAQKRAEIFLNNEKVKDTDLFFNSAFIDNLLPGQYQVKADKEGFLPWEKTLQISAQEVTEARHIFLLPENPAPAVLASQIQQVAWSPDKSRATFLEIEDGNTVLKLYDVSRKIKSHLLSGAELKEKQAEIIDARFSPDGQKLLVTAAVKESLRYFAAELSNGKPKVSSLNFLPDDLIGLTWHPTNSQQLLALQSIVQNRQSIQNLRLVNWQTKKIEPAPLTGDALVFAATDSTLYWLDSQGVLQSRGWQDSGPTVLTREPLELKNGETEKELLAVKNQIVFRQEQDLFWFDRREAAFKKIGRGERANFDPEGKRLAIANGHELWVYFFEPDSFQPSRQPGDLLFLTRLSSPLSQIFWLTSYYLGFISGEQLLTAELDERDRVQTWPLGQFPQAKLFFSDKTATLYIFSQNQLLALPF